MSSVRYRIYPSLLDKFQSLLDVEQTVEEFWNLDSEGEYKETADEMSDRLDRELLDAVNRVPHDPIEAADKGTCFNEVFRMNWLDFLTVQRTLKSLLQHHSSKASIP